jgi:hypothetical protein
MKTNQNYNRIFGTSVIAAAVSLCVAAPSAQAQSRSRNGNAPSVTVNSEAVDFAGQQPISQGGRVLVPLRGVLEKLGAYVQYDGAARVVTALKGDLNIRLPIGGREATVNQRPVSLDVPAQVVNGSTLVPLRFVAESLGANVDYNPAANTVAITAGQVAGGTPQPAPGGGGLGQSETIVGTVVAMYTDQTPRRIVLRTAGSTANQTIPLGNRVVVSLQRNGQDVPVTLERVDVGDRVSIRKNPRGVAQEITIVTRRQGAGGNRGENATTFTGRFDSYGAGGVNRSVITTQDSRTIEVPTNVPVIIDGRRVTLRELRDGDQITVTVNPNNGRGTRIVVNSRR